MYAYVRVCTCIYMYVRVCICMYIYIYTHEIKSMHQFVSGDKVTSCQIFWAYRMVLCYSAE